MPQPRLLAGIMARALPFGNTQTRAIPAFVRTFSEERRHHDGFLTIEPLIAASFRGKGMSQVAPAGAIGTVKRAPGRPGAQKIERSGLPAELASVRATDIPIRESRQSRQGAAQNCRLDILRIWLTVVCYETERQTHEHEVGLGRRNGSAGLPADAEDLHVGRQDRWNRKPS